MRFAQRRGVVVGEEVEVEVEEEEGEVEERFRSITEVAVRTFGSGSGMVLGSRGLLLSLVVVLCCGASC